MAEIDELVKDLAQTMAHKGIPPFLVATNIKEPNYSEIRLWKENGCIRVDTTCTIEDEDGRTTLNFRYEYDAGTVLQRITCTLAGRTEVYWDRQQEMAQKLRAIKECKRRAKEAQVGTQSTGEEKKTP